LEARQARRDVDTLDRRLTLQVWIAAVDYDTCLSQFEELRKGTDHPDTLDNVEVLRLSATAGTFHPDFHGGRM